MCGEIRIPRDVCRTHITQGNIYHYDNSSIRVFQLQTTHNLHGYYILYSFLTFASTNLNDVVMVASADGPHNHTNQVNGRHLVVKWSSLVLH